MRKNPYNRSEYLWTDRDMLKAVAFGAVFGAFLALIVYFEWFREPVITTFRPLIG